MDIQRSLVWERDIAACVRQHPCLYDKSLPAYKKASVKEEAWARVDEELRLPKGMGQRQFVILYKRYSRKRGCYKKALSHGNQKEIEKTKRDLAAYDFFHWFNAHLREYKNGKNLTSILDEYGLLRSNQGDEYFNQSDDEESTESLTMVQSNPTFMEEEKIFDEKPTSYHQTVVMQQNYESGNHCISPEEQQAPTTEISHEPETLVASFHPTPILVSEELNSACNSNHTPQPQRLSTAQQQQKTIEQVRTQQQQREIKRHCNEITSISSGTPHPDDVFGQMIAAELKTFPDHMKFRVKHELNNVLFKFREQQMTNGQL